MRYLIYIILFAFCVQAQADKKVRGRDFVASAYDSIAATIQDSISFPVDTLALQQLNMDEGRVAYMRGLDATNNPDKGGGWLSVVDSSDYSSILTTPTKSAEWFEHPTTDRVWCRDIYLIRRVGYLADFGVIGDNSNDDTEVVEKAFKSGIPLIGTGGDTCKITSTIKISDVPIHFSSTNGDYVSFISSMNDTMFYFTQTIDYISSTIDSLAKDAYQGGLCFVVNHPDSFSIKDLLKIVSTKQFYHSSSVAGRVGEINEVIKITGDTLWVARSIQDHYSVQSGADFVYVRRIATPNPLYIQDMNCIYQNSTSLSYPGLMIEYKNKPHLFHCRIDSAIHRGIFLKECLDFTVDKCEVYNSNKASAGYGINPVGCSGGTIEGCYVYRSRHGIEVSGTTIPSHDVVVRGNTLTGGGDFSTHNMSEGTIFQNNIINCYGNEEAFVIRGEDVKILNNIVSGNLGNSLVWAGSATNLQVIGNSMSSNSQWDVDTVQYDGDTVYRQRANGRWLVFYQKGTVVEWHDNLERNSVVIKDNTMFHLYSAANSYCGVFYISGFDTLWNLEISNNTVGTDRIDASYNNTWIIYSADTTSLSHSKIFGNNLINIQGGWQHFHDIIFLDSCYWEILDDNGTKMVNDIWTYHKVFDMDSSDVCYMPPGVVGNGEVKIDTSSGNSNNSEGIGTFHFNVGAVPIIDDTTGYPNVFSLSNSAGKLCIYDNGTHLAIKNNLGDDRMIKIKVEYYIP